MHSGSSSRLRVACEVIVDIGRSVRRQAEGLFNLESVVDLGRELRLQNREMKTGTLGQVARVQAEGAYELGRKMRAGTEEAVSLCRQARFNFDSTLEAWNITQNDFSGQLEFNDGSSLHCEGSKKNLGNIDFERAAWDELEDSLVKWLENK